MSEIPTGTGLTYDILSTADSLNYLQEWSLSSTIHDLLGARRRGARAYSTRIEGSQMDRSLVLFRDFIELNSTISFPEGFL